jgi:hypothetical protein
MSISGGTILWGPKNGSPQPPFQESHKGNPFFPYFSNPYCRQRLFYFVVLPVVQKNDIL